MPLLVAPLGAVSRLVFVVDGCGRQARWLNESFGLGLQSAADLNPFRQLRAGDGCRRGKKMGLCLPEKFIEPALSGDVYGIVAIQFKSRQFA